MQLIPYSLAIENIIVFLLWKHNLIKEKKIIALSQNIFFRIKSLSG